MKQVALTLTLTAALALTTASAALAVPKVIVISLDGARPDIFEQLFNTSVINRRTGIGILRTTGSYALQNITIQPSVTAAAHIAIATGSTAVNNDIPANTYHLVSSNFTSNISGFGGPIGGYSTVGPTVSPNPTAEPLWVRLRAAGKRVATATWPGGDGVNVTLPGTSTLIQPASVRTVDYTVPFGAFAGAGANGYTLNAASFADAPAATVSQLTAAGKFSYSPIKQKATPLETLTIGGVSYTIQVATLDTTDDGVTNYDTLVFFDTTNGIQPGPFALPATGPAYVKASSNASSLFYFQGSSNRAGAAYYVSALAPDLSTVRLGRYSANAIPRNATVIADVDDINNNVGFWAPQPDFRIPERLSPGFTNFPDSELEAMYEDQIRLFVEYQTRVGLRAITQNPDADLVMIYIEQPDGSGHQFTLTDPRQATDFTNPATINAGQDQAKISRYATYVQTAYKAANSAVNAIIKSVGRNAQGVPNSNIFVVSDHGMAPFHTAVSINNLLTSNGISLSQARAVSTGPAVNIYISLQGREPNGTVSPADYVTLQNQIVTILNNAVDANSLFNYSTPNGRLFQKVVARPTTAPVGFATNADIGQDSGDVFAILDFGYNFDGTQSPVVQRQGDPVSATPVLSVSNFYGAHGYDSTASSMSAIFYAAGPNIRRLGSFPTANNIDVTPTVMSILGVTPAPTVQGTVLTNILQP